MLNRSTVYIFLSTIQLYSLYLEANTVLLLHYIELIEVKCKRSVWKWYKIICWLYRFFRLRPLCSCWLTGEKEAHDRLHRPLLVVHCSSVSTEQREFTGVRRSKERESCKSRKRKLHAKEGNGCRCLHFIGLQWISLRMLFLVGLCVDVLQFLFINHFLNHWKIHGFLCKKYVHF